MAWKGYSRIPELWPHYQISFNVIIFIYRGRTYLKTQSLRKCVHVVGKHLEWNFYLPNVLYETKNMYHSLHYYHAKLFPTFFILLIKKNLLNLLNVSVNSYLYLLNMFTTVWDICSKLSIFIALWKTETVAIVTHIALNKIM